MHTIACCVCVCVCVRVRVRTKFHEVSPKMVRVRVKLKVTQNNTVRRFVFCFVTERRDVLRCLQMQLAVQNKAWLSLLA